MSPKEGDGESDLLNWPFSDCIASSSVQNAFNSFTSQIIIPNLTVLSVEASETALFLILLAMYLLFYTLSQCVSTVFEPRFIFSLIKITRLTIT